MARNRKINNKLLRITAKMIRSFCRCSINVLRTENCKIRKIKHSFECLFWRHQAIEQKMRIWATIKSISVALRKNCDFQKTIFTHLFVQAASRQILEINKAITMSILRLRQLWLAQRHKKNLTLHQVWTKVKCSQRHIDKRLTIYHFLLIY